MSVNNKIDPMQPPISPLYFDEGEDDVDNDKQFLLKRETTKRKSRRRTYNPKNNGGILGSIPSIIVQKKLISLRSILLASSLSLTLLTFWLLDSLKDPVFATMVEGNLNKHQPLAKMASVGGTLVLVVLMEVISHARRKRGNNADSDKVMSDEEVEDGGGVWTKMAIGSQQNQQENYFYDGNDDTDTNNSNKIPISTFKVVGFAYIFAFGLLSYFISLHPDFAGVINVDDPLSITSSDEMKKQHVWYFLGYFQYICIESFGSIAVATFWSFANSTLTLKAAKTYYGFIIAIAQIGAIGGSTIATSNNISIPNFFQIACLGILLQIGVMQIYGHKFPYPMQEDDDVIFFNDEDINDYETELEKKALKARRDKRSTSAHQISITKQKDENGRFQGAKVFFSGVFLILKYNYLLLILGVSCLYEISLTCLDYEMKLIGLDRFTAPPDVMGDINEANEAYSETNSTADAFATFMGRYGQLTNLLSLLLSYYLFPYLMSNYGLKHTLRLFPSLLLCVMFMAFVALPMNLPVLFVSMSLLKALTYSINDPAKEILYIPTSNVVKFKAKFWIDVVGARIAKAIGSSINTYAGTAERIVQYGSLPSVLTSVALWLVCYAAGMKFDELLENGDIVGIEEDEAENSFSSFDEGCDDDEEEASILNENDNSLVRAYSSDSGWESSVTVELVQSSIPEHASRDTVVSNK